MDQGSCSTKPQIITPEGGVRIICEVGEKAVAKAKTAKDSGELEVYMHPPKSKFNSVRKPENSLFLLAQ